LAASEDRILPPVNQLDSCRCWFEAEAQKKAADEAAFQNRVKPENLH